MATCSYTTDTCCRNSTYFNLPFDDPEAPSLGTRIIQDTKCGVRNREEVAARISGAQGTTEAGLDEWPHMCIVLRRTTSPSNGKEEIYYHSGASLIAPNIVLTAAHKAS